MGSVTHIPQVSGPTLAMGPVMSAMFATWRQHNTNMQYNHVVSSITVIIKVNFNCHDNKVEPMIHSYSKPPGF